VFNLKNVLNFSTHQVQGMPDTRRDKAENEKF